MLFLFSSLSISIIIISMYLQYIYLRWMWKHEYSRIDYPCLDFVRNLISFGAFEVWWTVGCDHWLPLLELTSLRAHQLSDRL